MTLYHVSFQPVPLFVPRIPETRAPGENDTIKRICFSDSILHALHAIPNAGDILDYFINQENIPLFLYIYSMESDQLADSDWMDWKQVEEYVPDAMLTKECWVMRSINAELLNCKKIEISAVTIQRLFDTDGTYLNYIRNITFQVTHSSDDNLSKLCMQKSTREKLDCYLLEKHISVGQLLITIARKEILLADFVSKHK